MLRVFWDEEGLADLEILDGEGATLEELNADFESEFDESGGWENDARVDLVVLEVGEVAGVETGGPGRIGAREAAVEESASAGREAAVAPVAGFAPPAGAVPSVGGRCDEAAGRGDGGEIEGRLRLDGGRGRYRGGCRARARGGRRRRSTFVGGVAVGEAFAERLGEDRVGADLEPDVDLVVGGDGIDGVGEEDGLTDAVGPMGRRRRWCHRSGRR